MSAIHVQPVADLDHGHDRLIIGDLVQDANVTLSDAVLGLAAELLATGRSGIDGQAADAPDDSPSVSQLEGFELASS
jgi:hypothetical protein